LYITARCFTKALAHYMKAPVMLLAPLRRGWYAMNGGFSRADTDKSLCFS
jgi:hypothetical protein